MNVTRADALASPLGVRLDRLTEALQEVEDILDDLLAVASLNALYSALKSADIEELRVVSRATEEALSFVARVRVERTALLNEVSREAERHQKTNTGGNDHG